MGAAIMLNGNIPTPEFSFQQAMQPAFESLQNQFGLNFLQGEGMNVQGFADVLEGFNSLQDAMEVAGGVLGRDPADIIKGVSGLSETFLDNMNPMENADLGVDPDAAADIAPDASESFGPALG